MWPECPLSVVTALSRGGTPNPPSANATFSLARSQICSEIPSTHMSHLLWRSNPSLACRALGQGGPWDLEKEGRSEGSLGANPPVPQILQSRLLASLPDCLPCTAQGSLSTTRRR